MGRRARVAFCQTPHSPSYLPLRDMGYIEKNLLADEEVIIKNERHIAGFILPPAIPLVIGAGLLSMDGFLAFVGLPFLLIGIWVAIKNAVIVMTNEVALTSKRMIGKYGFIRQHSLDVRTPFVSGISVNQGLFGRLLNYGTIVVKGDGETFPFAYTKDPSNMRNVVQGYLAERAQPHGRPSASGAS